MVLSSKKADENPQIEKKVVSLHREKIKELFEEITAEMPEISRFYGVIILMFIDDHNPPHIHVRYGGSRVSITIENHTVKGQLPPRLLNMVLQWMDKHHDELVENWKRLERFEDPNPIAPFEK